jgi:hypothetical protein
MGNEMTNETLKPHINKANEDEEFLRMVSYAHEGDPEGHRFCQYEKDPLPIWAVDVKPHIPKDNADEFIRMAEECGAVKYCTKYGTDAYAFDLDELKEFCKKVQDMQREKDQAKIAAKNAALTMAYKSMYLVKHSFGHQFPLAEIKDALNK